MSKLELRPRFFLGVLLALGALIIIGILATGVTAKDEPVPQPAVDPRAQQRTLQTLQEEIAETEEQFRTNVTPQKETIKELFSLAQTHGVTILGLDNKAPEAEQLGRTDFEKLATHVKMRGTRDNVIGMLLEFRETMLIGSVGVKGTPEAWEIEFVLTQYLRSS